MQVLDDVESRVMQIIFRAISEDAAMDIDAESLVNGMKDILADRQRLTATKVELEEDVRKLTRMQTMLKDIKCDCPKLESELLQINGKIEDIRLVLDARKFSYAEHVSDLQTLFSEVKARILS